jgi:hypothetical protein
MRRDHLELAHPTDLFAAEDIPFIVVTIVTVAHLNVNVAASATVNVAASAVR